MTNLDFFLTLYRTKTEKYFVSLVPPGWEIEPRDLTVAHREMAIINCAAVGNPRPTISWRKSPGDTSMKYFP